ncbi:MAG: prepilin peptidase [Spirochaetes bacterium]|nr:prepilin peptidase [Spirochaetota bacterium]
METNIFVLFIAFLFGASWGSFLYTFILRYIDGTYSNNAFHALTYPSHCPYCKEKIKTAYLIPIAGYFLARGRCSECKQSISFLYPLSEIACGCVAIATLLFFNWAIAPAYFIAITTSVCIAIIDVITMEIPNFLVGILFLSGIIVCATEGEWVVHFQGAALLFAVFIVPLLLIKGGFGGGDVKFAAAIGFFLGLYESIVALEIALITGALYGIGYAVFKSKTLKVHIPFGPFLTLGFILSLLVGKDVVQIYFSFLNKML